MTKRLQRGAVASSHPLWLRALALACLMVVGWVSSAQAAHIHGDWLPQHATHLSAPADASQLPGSEERCPLCVAMHLALPVSPATASLSLVSVELKAVSAADRLPSDRWHFAMFSRPPPARQAVSL